MGPVAPPVIPRAPGWAIITGVRAPATVVDTVPARSALGRPVQPPGVALFGGLVVHVLVV